MFSVFNTNQDRWARVLNEAVLLQCAVLDHVSAPVGLLGFLQSASTGTKLRMYALTTQDSHHNDLIDSLVIPTH